jgi:mRNA interferase MazF
MEGFVKGDIIVIPFLFSDLSGSKKRPALVLADLQGNDITTMPDYKPAD